MGWSDDEMEDIPIRPVNLPEGIKKEIIKEADDEEWRKPRTGDVLTVHYVGTLEKDGSQFDSSRDRGEPIQFNLGKGEVIKGWDLGIASMKKGEIAKFTFQPEFAYGERGHPPTIPSNAVLVFEVELISWSSKDDLYGDGGVIKTQVKEGTGWKNAKEGEECCVSLKATAEDKSVIDEWTKFDYVVQSGVFGPLSDAVDKALVVMREGEQAELLIAKNYLYKNASYGQVKVDLVLEAVYDIKDVSIMQDGSVKMKILGEGEDGVPQDARYPHDGFPVTLRIEAATDGEKMLAGWKGAQDIDLACGGAGGGEVTDLCDPLVGAIKELKKGERALVTCFEPSKCKCVSLGLTDISAAKVVFTIELIESVKGPDQWKLHPDSKVQFAAIKKDEGADLFKAKRFELALRKYEKVLELVGEKDEKTGVKGDTFSEDVKPKADEIRKAAKSNKAACYLSMGDNTACLAMCNSILADDRNNIKVLFRRAKAHNGRREFKEAIQDLDRLLELDPTNAEAKALLPRCKKAQKDADKESQGTFGKMCQAFGSLPEQDRSKPKGKPKPKEPKEYKEDKTDCQVCFQIELDLNHLEETLWVYGAAEKLGAWDVEKAVQLKKAPHKLSPEDIQDIQNGKEPKPWRWMEAVDVMIPETEGRSEYKYFIKGPGGTRMEEGSKHVMQLAGSGGSRQRLKDKWRNAGD